MSKTQPTLNTGDEVEVEIYKLTNFGAFVKLANGKRGLIHISQISDDFVKNISEHLKIGDKVKARIATLNGNRIELTLKKPKENIGSYPKDKGFKSSALEEKLSIFLKDK